MATASWAAFENLYVEAQKPNSQQVYLVDEMLKMLLAIDGAYKKVIHCKQVGIHKTNREGLGIVESSVHGIGEDIHEDGFVWKAVEEACCFEDAPDKSNAIFTASVCNGEPSLANFNVHEIGFAAVACTHANQSLAAAVDGCVTDRQKIAIDGKISVAILSQNKNFEKALRDGIEWTVVKHEVEREFPPSCLVSSRGRNTKLALRSEGQTCGRRSRTCRRRALGRWRRTSGRSTGT